MTTNSFGSRAQIAVGSRKIDLYRLDALVKARVGDVETLPFSLRILLENLLRFEDGAGPSTVRTSKPSPAGTRSTASITRCSSARHAC
jgi:aconitase A